MTVNEYNQVEVNGVKYPIKGEVQPTLISNFPDKTVVGDYTADSNPLASSWVTSDLLGGIGSTSYELGSEKNCWWSNCILNYEGHIPLPRLATAITLPTITATDEANLDWETWSDASTPGTWTEDVGLTRATSPHGGTYCGSVVVNTSWTLVAHQHITWSTQYRGRVFSVKGWGKSSTAYTTQDFGVKFAIYDGVNRTYTSRVGAAANTWEETTQISHIVAATASELTIEVYCRTGDGTTTCYFDDIEFTDPTSGTLSKAVNFEGDQYWAYGNTLIKLAAGRASFEYVWTFPATITYLIASINNNLYIYLGDDTNYYVMYHGRTSTATLAEALDTSEVLVDVSAGTAFSVNDIITIESEDMWVTGIATNTLTVIRAWNGTTAATHVTGLEITVDRVAQNATADANWGFQWDDRLFKVNTDGDVAYSIDPDVAAPTWTATGTISDIYAQIESFVVGDDFIEGTVPYCVTNSAIRVLDFANSKWIDTALRLPNHPNGGKGACHWRDGLYFSSGLDVLKYQSAQIPQIDYIGISRAGGLPTEYNGEIVKLNGDGINEMFALVDASQVTGTGKSGLYAWDGYGWKCWWIDTANDGAMHDVIVSPAASAYAVYWDVGGAIYYIDLPRGVNNPTYLTSQAYLASGVLLTSWFNGGWRVGNKRANRVRIGCKGMSTNETLVVKYRTNKVNVDVGTGWTTLGTITSTGETIYTFGSGVGEIFRDIQFRVDFARGSTTTNSPVLSYVTLEYNKIIAKVWQFQFMLDCSRDDYPTPGKTLLSTLITAAETETLITFVYRGTTYYVEVVSVQGSQNTGDMTKGDYAVIVREVM